MAVELIIGQTHRIVGVHDADKDAGPAARERRHIKAGAFNGLPRRLQQQALLRIDGHGLARADAEEGRIELRRIVQEPALQRDALARRVGVGIIEIFDPPVPVGWKRRDGVAALGHQPPQILRGLHIARITAAHADNGDRVVIRNRGCRQCGQMRGEACLPVGEELGVEPCRKGCRGGVIKQKGCRQADAGGGGEPVAQFDRHE